MFSTNTLLSSNILSLLSTGAQEGHHMDLPVSERWGWLTVYKSCSWGSSHPTNQQRGSPSHVEAADGDCESWEEAGEEKPAVSSLAGRKVKSLKWKKSFVASFSSLLDLKAHRWTVWFSLTALINLVSSSSRQLFYSLWLGAEDSRSLSPIIDSWNQTEVTCQVFPFEHTAQISSFCELC